MSEVTRKPRGQKNRAETAGCPLFEALRRRANYALKTTTNEFIERVKRNNAQEKEGILFCPVVEVVSSGLGGFCMRQTQGIIFRAWRANGNLSSCNLLASLDPPEFVLFHSIDGDLSPNCCNSSDCATILLPQLLVSLHVRIRIVSYDAVLAAKSRRLTTHLTARAEQELEEARTARRKLGVLSSYSATRSNSIGMRDYSSKFHDAKVHLKYDSFTRQ